jgi:hypothetical protein
MEATITGTMGRTYHLLPHERWFAERLLRRSKSASASARRTFSGGPAAVALRGSRAANALIVSPLSVVYLIVLSLNEDHFVSDGPKSFQVMILIYVVVLGPFVFLQVRRAFQSTREAHDYREASQSSFSG